MRRLFFLAALLQVGCSTPLSLPISFLPERAPVDLGPLEYYQWSNLASPAELETEQVRLEDRSDLRTNPIPAVQFAIVSSAFNRDSAAEFGDSLQMLRSMQRNCFSERCETYVMFGTVFSELLNSREELGATLAEQSEREMVVSALRARIAALEEQIDALTNLEQQLINRELPEIQNE
jgi:hypothetical protein